MWKKFGVALFTRVPVNLYRLGNASGPRLDNIRPRDVPIVEHSFGDGSTTMMVRPEGGVSTFDAINPNLKGDKWWMIPKDTPIPDTISVIRDRRDPKTGISHYSLRPKQFMSLLSFAQGIKELSEYAKPVFVVSKGVKNDKTGAGGDQ